MGIFVGDNCFFCVTKQIITTLDIHSISQVAIFLFYVIQK